MSQSEWSEQPESLQLSEMSESQQVELCFEMSMLPAEEADQLAAALRESEEMAARYATDGELQRGGGASGLEYGCRGGLGGAFGWCRASDGPLPKREAALRQGQLSAAWKVQRKR